MINHLDRLRICVADLRNLSKVDLRQVIDIRLRFVTTNITWIFRDSNRSIYRIQKALANHNMYIIIFVPHLIQGFRRELHGLISEYFGWHKYGKRRQLERSSLH